MTPRRLHGWAAGALGGLRGVRVVPAANLHVTLVFCGHHPPEAADELASAVDEAFAGEPAYAFACRGVRAFGSAIAVELEPLGAPAPAAAQARLEQRLVAAGLARDEGRRWIAARDGRPRRPGRLATAPRGASRGPAARWVRPALAAYTTEPASGGVSYRRVGWAGRRSESIDGADRAARRRTVSDNKDQALAAALGQIEKQFGKGSIMRLGDESHACPWPPSRPAGSSLDLALGVGGVPRGRIVEIFGPESSGKTTLCYHIIAQAQKLGGVVRLHRRRARARPGLRPPHRRRRRRAAGQPARQRRAGARDRRDADPLRRARRHLHRLGRGARAARPRSRARWATRSSACRRG